MSAAATAVKAAYLIVHVTLSTAGGGYTKAYKMQDMDTCLASVKAAQVKVPQGGDAETTVTVFCSSSSTSMEKP